MIDYTLILRTEYSGDEWSLNGDDYAGLTWLSSTPKPSKATLDGKWAKVLEKYQADIDAKAEAKAALLERLGITAAEAHLLLA
jgi:hypothetical protein